MDNKQRRALLTYEELSRSYLDATEWQLATLERLTYTKSSSRSAIRRQLEICERMLYICNVVLESAYLSDLGKSKISRTVKYCIDPSTFVSNMVAQIKETHPKFKAEC
jgi:hypothetical protein